jgi:hypothetical protein
MKVNITTPVTILSIIVLILIDGYFNVGHTRVAGAPAGCCGSIAVTSTCTSCHSGGPNTVQPGWITSTIPSTGYVPGTTYLITATATYTGRSRFGFEISPQNTAGTYLGTCSINPAEINFTQLVTGTSSRKYMTHRSAGTTGSTNSHTWTFNWTAPPAGSGPVTFYGAFLCANNNGGSSGDITYKSNLPVQEDVSTGISDNASGISNFNVFPNPATDHLTISYEVSEAGTVSIHLMDINGRVAALISPEEKTPGSYTNMLNIPFNVNNGIYFVEISSKTGKTARRILIQH